MAEPRLRLVSWNMRHLAEAWDHLAEDKSIDIALLQEAAKPSRAIPWSVPGTDDEWRTEWGRSPYCAAVVGLNDRHQHEPIATIRLPEVEPGKLGVSVAGTVAAVEVEIPDDEPLTLVSVYSVWQRPAVSSSWILADASAHRLISDVSTLIGREKGHRIIVAGDWNIVHGYGEYGRRYWEGRYATVFDRMAAIGLPFVGPQHPNGEQASPWPDELPKDSKNVPTYRSQLGRHDTATRQLDFVFASEGLKDRLTVRALNRASEWGPSDHCRVLIEYRSR